MTDQIDTNVENADETPVEQAATPEATLTIQDLTTAMQVIQVTGARGAIRADEMAVVGALYNKIFAFLDAAGAIKRDEAPAEAANDAEADDAGTDADAGE